MSEYTGASVRLYPGNVDVQASTARTTTSAVTVPPVVWTTGW